MAIRAAGVAASAVGSEACRRGPPPGDRLPRCCVLVAEDDRGELVGICTVYQDLHSVRFGYRAWVEDLAVHPEHRSQGIGSKLLAAARDWARERGATHLELDSALTREDAHRFYEREQPSWRSYSYAWEL